MRPLLFFIILSCFMQPLLAQPRNLSELPEVPFSEVANEPMSALGRKALSIHPEKWKHSVSDHFIYHYYDNFVATSVSVEGEFYYKAIARELGKSDAPATGKSHIFIFQTKADWKAFQGAAELDPWTGGIQYEGELYLLRDTDYRWKDQTLGHEIAHLVINRFFGDGAPLWFNEGYAENVATRNFQAFLRGRGLSMGPKRRMITESNFIPLEEFAAIESYPEDPIKVAVYYEQAELLVRFLFSQNREAFFAMLKDLTEGQKFETALMPHYADFPSLMILEEKFKPYAVRNIQN